MSASASLVLGWRLDKLCEIRKVEGKKKFDPDTGKPVKNPVDALFVLGVQVPSPEEPHPCEWDDILGMKIYSIGDGSDQRHGEGLRSYDLEKFVAGYRIGSTDRDSDCNGALVEVHIDQRSEQSKALQGYAELCEKLGIKEVVAGENLPKFYLVCYSSY